MGDSPVEKGPYQSGDKATPFEKGENARRATLKRQEQMKAEAARALERRNRGGDGRAKRFLGDMALTLDGVSLNQDPRFE